MVTPSSDGWGRPGDRPIEQVLTDIEDGVISAGRAAADYPQAAPSLGQLHG